MGERIFLALLSSRHPDSLDRLSRDLDVMNGCPLSSQSFSCCVPTLLHLQIVLLKGSRSPAIFARNAIVILEA